MVVALLLPGIQVRVDTGIVEGSTISMFYDPMISKVMCTRAYALLVHVHVHVYLMGKSLVLCTCTRKITIVGNTCMYQQYACHSICITL